MSDDVLVAVRALVNDLVEVVADDAPLDLDSLTLVQIAEELEARFEFVVRAADLTPANFDSVAAMAAYVRAR